MEGVQRGCRALVPLPGIKERKRHECPVSARGHPEVSAWAAMRVLWQCAGVGVPRCWARLMEGQGRLPD